VYSHLPFPTFLTSCLAVLATRNQCRVSLEWAHARPLFHSAQAWERPVYLIVRLRSICSLRTGRIVSRDFFTGPVSEPGDCFTPELLRYSSTPSRQLLLVGTLLPSFPTREYLDLTHCDCPLLLKQNRTFPSTVFSTYTIEEIWQLAHGVQQRCCPLNWWQSNTAWSRMECSRHSQLFGRYRCAQEHPCFYALTTLFLFISRYKRSHTRADKQDGNSNDDPIFSPTYFHSVKRPIPRVLSALIMMALQGSTHLHCFSACSSWPTVWLSPWW